MNDLINNLIQMGFLPIGIIVFLLMLLYLNDSFGTVIFKSFKFPIILLILLVISDNLELVFLTLKINNWFHIFLTYNGYNLRLAIMLALIFRTLKDSYVKHKWVLFLPLLSNMIICSLAFKTQLVFWFDESGMHRGLLSYIPHFISGVYGIILLLICMYKSSIGRSSEASFLGFSLTFSMSAMVIETVTQVHGLLMGSLILNVLGYYLLLYIEHYNYDPLTGVLNRMSFNSYLKNKGDKIYAIFSIDMNNLKNINDTEGHIAGDNAIKKVSNVIYKSIPLSCKLFRIGGDEFVILVFEDNLNLQHQAERILKNMSETKYSVSCGWSIVTKDTTIEEAYKVADDMMYVNKAKMKSTMEVG